MSDELFDDEYDPLAPMVGADDPAPERKEEPPLGGFGPSGIVRLTFEEGRLATVRVAPNWFDILGPGQTLEAAFMEALILARLDVHTEEPSATDLSDLEFDLPPFNASSVDAYAAMLHDHSRRWQAAIDAPHQEIDPPEARGEHSGVVVALDRTGFPARVQFDEDWLDEVQVGTICTAVVGATNRAYAAYTPPSDQRQETLDRYRREHEVLMAGFRALLDPNRKES